MTQERKLVMVIHPDAQVHDQTKRILERHGYEVRCLAESAQAEPLIRALKPSLIFTGIGMPEKNGFDILREAVSINPFLPVIAITTHASITGAIRFLKAGGVNYLAAPFSVDQLIEAAEAATCNFPAAAPTGSFLGPVAGDALHAIIGNTRRMVELKRAIAKVAATDVNVLIRGETGTGKELVAHAIHQLSRRKAGPFLPVDCASLPPTLLESELFGHQRGAFTGADRARCGLFQAASCGTMFLDEIAELDPSTQSTLFRVLQEGKIRQIGGRRDTPIDVRVLAATNRDLERGIKDGTFRQELYFRLKVVTIALPSLRERREDILLLADHFFGLLRNVHRRPDLAGMEPSFLSSLLDYPWPGNIRELKNAIEQAVVLSDGPTLTGVDLLGEMGPLSQERLGPVDGQEFEEGIPDYMAARERVLESFDRDYFQRLLSEFSSNLSEAARKSGIGRKTLYNRLRKIGILPFDSADAE